MVAKKVGVLLRNTGNLHFCVAGQICMKFQQKTSIGVTSGYATSFTAGVQSASLIMTSLMTP